MREKLHLHCQGTGSHMRAVAEANDQNPVVVVEVDLNKQLLWPWLGDLKNRIPREKPGWETIAQKY